MENINVRPTNESNNNSYGMNCLRDGVVYLNGLIDESVLLNVIQPLVKEVDDKKKYRNAKIDVYVSSYGGYVYICQELIEIFEYAKKNDIIIATNVLSFVASAASLIAISGTKGYRRIGRHAKHLLHYGSIFKVEQSPSDTKRGLKVSKENWNFVVDTYKKYSNVPNLEQKLDKGDFTIYREKLIKYGLADKYYGE